MREPRPAPLAFDALVVDAGPTRWAACNSSKPGRSADTWVIHAAPEWTLAHFDDAPAAVADELAASLCKTTGLNPAAIDALTAHRWRYSRVVNPLVAGALCEPKLALGLCGDWCQMARIEGANLSGQAIAGRVLGHLAQRTLDDRAGPG